jgi:type II secretory pathway component HofQ
MNGQEANIDIVEEIPYQQLTLGEGQTTATTLFKEVGIKLKVKPQINRDGSVVLNVAPEQSFRTGESIDSVPVISTSKSNTTFIIKNTETAVIGGLIRETDSQSEYKVPLLGDIPVLGYLFKRSDKQKVRTELTIFITAKVVQQ